MLGMSEQHIVQMIETECRKNPNADILERIARSVAKAIAANNAMIERHLAYKKQ